MHQARDYLLSDHLGSTTMVQERSLAPLRSHVTANSSGALYSEKRYMPWGEQRWASGTMPTTVLYTGQHEQEELGQYFYQSRWYDPYLNQFIQREPIVPDRFIRKFDLCVLIKLTHTPAPSTLTGCRAA
jgi:RHS repeat-associated protein